MSGQRGQPATERRGAPPGALPTSGPVLATLTADELAAFTAREIALRDAREAAQDAELELQHFAMKLRQKHKWKAPNVRVDTQTGDVIAWEPSPQTST